MTMLSLLSGRFSIFAALTKLWERWALRREARRLAEADLVTQEAEHSRKAAEIVAEHRSDDDAARRLRDGTF
jgi:hypothetical protein